MCVQEAGRCFGWGRVGDLGIVAKQRAAVSMRKNRSRSPGSAFIFYKIRVR